MSDFLEFEKETKAIKSINLDDFSIEELKDYIDQLKQHLKPQFPIHAILLDNMNREQTIKCVQYIKENWPLCFIESSGGINLKNIQNYIGTGIHAVSIGSLTHQAVSKNIKLEFEK